MHGKRNCCINSCPDSAVATLVRQDLCLNHFLAVCYEHLERLEPLSARVDYSSADLDSRKEFVEECSREALRVGLHGENLCNLQRGRLLDILLWAGDLFVSLRTRMAAPASFFATVNKNRSSGAEGYQDSEVIQTRQERSSTAAGKSANNMLKHQAAGV